MLKQDQGARGVQDAIGKALAIIPLTPNQWTMLSLLVALAAGAAIAVKSDLALGLILFAIAALFDMIDGAVARARKETSAFGGFLDGVVDRFVEAIFLLSLMFVPLPFIFADARVWLALTIFLGTCMPSFVRAYADHKGVISKEKALALGGICERSERLGLIIIGLAAGLALSMDYFIYALMLVCALSLVTIIQRVSAVAHTPRVRDLR
ncbi:CDP-alcohol phosphatidyltransferase family protein [Candidatus Micrarchaeota archaeon]|nr:CDP-alcohol phosphatidyltransferase family protein [Candidatus Micrarchaeota archaeon]